MPINEILNTPSNCVVTNPQTETQLRRWDGVTTVSLLTGIMGAGKSTLRRLLSEIEGVIVIDADQVAKDTIYAKRLDENTPALKVIFGESIFIRSDLGRVESVDLKEVGRLFFGSRLRRAAFEAKFTPQIIGAIKEEIVRARSRGSGYKYVFVENAVAIEKGWLDRFDWNHVICVVCSEENQWARLMKRRNMTEDDHRARMTLQLSAEEKMSYSDIVVVTNGEEDTLRKCAVELLDLLSNG